MDSEFQDRMDNLLQDSKKADQEDKKLIENMKRLVASHDFDMFCRQVLGPRIQDFGATLLQPAGSVDGMVKAEFVKGALFGLCLARDLPSVIISTTQKQEEPNE